MNLMSRREGTNAHKDRPGSDTNLYYKFTYIYNG